MALLWSSSLSTLRSTYSSITSIKVNLESWSSEYTIFYTPCIPDTYLFSSQYYYLKWISMPHTKFWAFLGGDEYYLFISIFMIFWYEMVWKIGQSWILKFRVHNYLHPLHTWYLPIFIWYHGFTKIRLYRYLVRIMYWS